MELLPDLLSLFNGPVVPPFSGLLLGIGRGMDWLRAENEEDRCLLRSESPGNT